MTAQDFAVNPEDITPIGWQGAAQHTYTRACDGFHAPGECSGGIRITVALIPQAAEDLQRLQERTSLSKTDLVNRAITLYEFIDAQNRASRDILIRDTTRGETQVVRLL